MTTTERTVSPALAAWESATVQNLGPYLTDAQDEAVWSAIVAHREHGDADRLRTAILAAIPPSLTLVREKADRAIVALPSAPLHAVTE